MKNRHQKILLIACLISLFVVLSGCRQGSGGRSGPATYTEPANQTGK